MNDIFNNMNQAMDQFFSHPAFKTPSVAYCDYIAHIISKELKANDAERLLSSVGRIQFDVDDDGAYRSTKKTVLVEDRNGKKYKITVEEA